LSSEQVDADSAVAALYTAAVDPTAWSAALDKLCALSGAQAANCFVQDTLSGEFSEYHYRGYDDSAANLYMQHYGQIDLPLQSVLSSRPGKLQTVDHLLSRSDIARSEFYQDFYIPEGFAHPCGGLLMDGDNRIVLGLHRPTGMKPYEDNVKADLQRVLDHLPHVFRVRDMARSAQHAALASTAGLDALPRGVVIVDRALRLRYLNPAAARVLKAGPELRIVARQLAAADAASMRSLQTRVRQACLPTPKVSRVPICIPDRDGRPCLEVHVVPIPLHVAAGLQGESASAMVTLRRPFGPSQWRLATPPPCGLSPAEAAVVDALVEGCTPTEIALRHGVRITTVRSQIAAVLRKTGARRIGDVIKQFSVLEQLPEIDAPPVERPPG
jgi:DNA-binding CsgD family transcriptional regulator/PAS domain-containing protein